MSQRQATINVCDVCRHEWLPNPIMGLTSNYTHCTSGKCRSRKWNKGAKQAVLEALTRPLHETAKALGKARRKRAIPTVTDMVHGYNFEVQETSNARPPCKLCHGLNGMHARGCKEKR